MLREQELTWEAFWRSPLAKMVVEADHPALRRLWRLRDEWDRCMRDAQESGRLDNGSTGQTALAPLYRHLVTLEGQIQKLEAMFGLTPMARLKLGVTLGEAKRSLADANRDAARGADSDGEWGGIVEATATERTEG
jgi:P27 family predicted phage terminase small subunit